MNRAKQITPPAFHVSALETDYWIFVSTPDATRDPGPWLAVVCLDGDDQFTAMIEAYTELRAQGVVPPLLLVGVGYGASYQGPANRRLRDYTPDRIPEEPGSGGADAFVEVLVTGLWPELSRRYPLREDTRALAGHSLGSLLALHALFRTRPFFNRVLASATSLWWADRAILGRVEMLRAAQADLPAHVFLSVGERDSRSMTGDLSLLEAQLAEKPFDGLRVTSTRFRRRNHFNVLPDAWRAGLTALFGSETSRV